MNNQEILKCIKEVRDIFIHGNYPTSANDNIFEEVQRLKRHLFEKVEVDISYQTEYFIVSNIENIFIHGNYPTSANHINFRSIQWLIESYETKDYLIVVL